MFRALISTLLLATAAFATSPVNLKPEDAYLSPTQYLNRYFGLSLSIPKDLGLVPIPLAKVQGVTRYLLAVGAKSPTKSVTLMITAGPTPKKDDVRSAIRNDFESDYPSPGKPVRINLGGKQFWKVAAPPKPDKDSTNTIEYAAIIGDYLLTIRASAEPGAVPDALRDAVEHVSFVSPAQIDTRRTADMVDYAGPALPELGQPTPAIAGLTAGAIDGRDYRNAQLGLDYRIPDPLYPRAIETVHDRIAPANSSATAGEALLEEQIARTCTRPLLFADDRGRPSGGHTNSILAVTALDPLCYQGARFPTSVRDSDAVQSIARALADRLHGGRPGAKMTGRVYELNGHMFVNLSGEFYEKEASTGLEVPNHIRMIITPLNGYWVLWTFVAPDTATLNRISSSTVQFTHPFER